MNIARKPPRRCCCGCYPEERWWPFAKCYVIKCSCCDKSVMHLRKGTARLLWYRLVSEFLTPAEEALIDHATSQEQKP